MKIEELSYQLYEQIYGPKFCGQCNKVQSVMVHELEGTRNYSSEGMKITVSFFGSRVCSVCCKTIEEKT